MQDSIRTLVKEIESHETQAKSHLVAAKELRETVSRLESLQRAIQTQDWGQVDLPVNVQPGQFRGKRVSVAIREYLAFKGKPASEEEIESALRAGNCDRFVDAKKLGSIKKAVDQSPKYLELANGLIYLKGESLRNKSA